MACGTSHSVCRYGMFRPPCEVGLWRISTRVCSVVFVVGLVVVLVETVVVSSDVVGSASRDG